jgi:hypothetical protein
MLETIHKNIIYKWTTEEPIEVREEHKEQLNLFALNHIAAEMSVGNTFGEEDHAIDIFEYSINFSLEWEVTEIE